MEHACASELDRPAYKIECIGDACRCEEESCIGDKESPSAFGKAVDTSSEIPVTGYQDTKRRIDDNKSVSDLKEEAHDVAVLEDSTKEPGDHCCKTPCDKAVEHIVLMRPDISHKIYPYKVILVASYLEGMSLALACKIVEEVAVSLHKKCCCDKCINREDHCHKDAVSRKEEDTCDEACCPCDAKDSYLAKCIYTGDDTYAADSRQYCACDRNCIELTYCEDYGPEEQRLGNYRMDGKGSYVCCSEGLIVERHHDHIADIACSIARIKSLPHNAARKYGRHQEEYGRSDRKVIFGGADTGKYHEADQ